MNKSARHNSNSSTLSDKQGWFWKYFVRSKLVRSEYSLRTLSLPPVDDERAHLLFGLTNVGGLIVILLLGSAAISAYYPAIPIVSYTILGMAIVVTVINFSLRVIYYVHLKNWWRLISMVTVFIVLAAILAGIILKHRNA